MKIRLMVSMLTVMLMCSGCSDLADERRDEDMKEEFCTVVADVGGISWNMEEPGVDDVNGSTRAIEANGEALKELWVFDCYEDSCALVAKQTDADDSFGMVSMQLSYGSHRLAFVASRGEGSDVDVKNGRIEWTKVKDTFWAVEDVEIAKGGAAEMSVTLKRVVSRMRVLMSDVVPQNMKKMRIAANGWYKGIDVRTGEAVGSLPSVDAVAETSEVDIPSVYVGTSKRLAVSLWSIGKSERWTQDVTIGVLDENRESIGEAVCSGVPMERNRVTNVAGYFLSGGKLGNILVDDGWDEGIDFEF